MVNVMKKALAAFPVVAAVCLLAASAAHAFTFENNPPDRSGGSSLVDPGDRVKSSGSPSAASPEVEGGTASGFHFSVGPGSAQANRPNTSPPPWSRDPLYLDKGGQ